MVGTFGASLRLAALIVGPRAIGARFGYGRRDMHGPSSCWQAGWTVRVATWSGAASGRSSPTGS
jgi:hypothetical protein